MVIICENKNSLGEWCLSLWFLNLFWVKTHLISLDFKFIFVWKIIDKFEDPAWMSAESVQCLNYLIHWRMVCLWIFLPKWFLKTYFFTEWFHFLPPSLLNNYVPRHGVLTWKFHVNMHIHTLFNSIVSSQRLS